MPIPFLAPLLAGAGKAAAALGGAKGVGALAGGAASLAGAVAGNRAQEQAANQMEQQRVANMGLIKDYGQRAIESLTPSYQNAQNIRQQALNQNLGLAGSTFQPMMQSMQTGDYMAQQALLAGLMGQRNAILGDPINYGALQAQSVPVDYSALTGLTNPQGLDFTQLETPEFSKSGQMDWSAFDAQNYLAANPSVKADYLANKEALIAGGDPQFTTLEGYAKWHYDNYGKASGADTELGVAQKNWTDSQAQSYLDANQDVLTEYNQDPTLKSKGFASPIQYAKWHYDRYGENEGRPLSAGTTESTGTTASALSGNATQAPQAVFTSEQVRNAISRMGGETP